MALFQNSIETPRSDRTPSTSLLRRISSAIRKRWGNQSAKQSAWDSEYSSGKWSYTRSSNNKEADDPIYGCLEKHGAGGSILDLGCGGGMTALEMKNNFGEYLGVDVSEVAVEKARSVLSKEADRAEKIQFMVSDIFTFEPPHGFSVILFRESIYYVPHRQIKGMLERYMAHLLPGGVLIVRLCDGLRYKGIVKVLEKEFDGEKVFTASDSRMCIIVCSPRRT
jgi:SAM-dependent methyltransferase